MPSKPPALEGLRALVRDLDAGSRSLPHYPRVPMLQQVQREWSELRSELQVRRSLRAEAPADGGPLNSAVLVQRMLDTMLRMPTKVGVYRDPEAFVEPSPCSAPGTSSRAWARLYRPAPHNN